MTVNSTRPKNPSPKRARQKSSAIFPEDVNLPLEDFLRGTTREVRINDPANPNGAEIYELVVPPDTAPGTRFRLPRAEPFAGGFVQLRVKVLCPVSASKCVVQICAVI